VESALTSTRKLFVHVPGTFRDRGWADRQIRLVRARPRDFASFSRPTMWTRQANSADIERNAGTDTVMNEYVGLSENAYARDPNMLETGDGGQADAEAAAFAEGLAALGLDAEDMAVELPELAVSMAIYVAFVNEASFRFASQLRSLFRGKTKWRLEAPLSLEERRERRAARRAAAREEAPADDSKEKLKTTRRVVRSVFKIVLGVFLGFLLWGIVRRI